MDRIEAAVARLDARGQSLEEATSALKSKTTSISRDRRIALIGFLLAGVALAGLLMFIALSNASTRAGLLDSCLSNNEAKQAQVDLYRTLLGQAAQNPDPSSSQLALREALDKAIDSITIPDCQVKYG